MLIDLATLFPNATGYATEARARAKLAEVTDGFPFKRSLFVVIPAPAPSTRWLPVIVLGSDDTVYAAPLAHAGVCVTN